MNTGNVLRGSFALGFLAMLLGGLFKLMHYPGCHWVLLAGLLAVLVFVVLAVVEISGSRRVAGNEKMLWLAALLLGNGLGALLYLAIGRSRVVGRPRL